MLAISTFLWCLMVYQAYGCEQNESQVFITAKQDLFDIKIKPVVLKDENRTSIMAFAGSGDFLKTKGHEKIIINAPKGRLFTTEYFCMETKDVRNIMVEWKLEKDVVYSKRLVPKAKGRFDEVCHQPNPKDTRADRIVLKFRRTKKGTNIMYQQSILFQTCVQVPPDVTDETETDAND